MWQSPKMLVHVLTSLLVHGIAVFLVLSIPIYAGSGSSKFMARETRNVTDPPGTEMVLLQAELSNSQQTVTKENKPKESDRPAAEVKRIISVERNLMKKPEKANREEAVSEQSVPVTGVISVTEASSVSAGPMIHVQAEARESKVIEAAPETAPAPGPSKVVSMKNEKPERADLAISRDIVQDQDKFYHKRPVETEQTVEPEPPERQEPQVAKHEKISDNGSDLEDRQQPSGTDKEDIVSAKTVSPPGSSVFVDKESGETKEAVESAVEHKAEQPASPKSPELISPPEDEQAELTSHDTEEKNSALESSQDLTALSSASPSPTTSPNAASAGSSEQEPADQDADIFAREDGRGIFMIQENEDAAKEALGEKKSIKGGRSDAEANIAEASALKKDTTARKFKRIPEGKKRSTVNTASEPVPTGKDSISKELHDGKLMSDIRHALEPYIKNPTVQDFTVKIPDKEVKEKEKHVPGILNRRLADDIRRALKPFLDYSIEEPASQKRGPAVYRVKAEQMKEQERKRGREQEAIFESREEQSATTQVDVKLKNQQSAVLTTSIPGTSLKERSYPELEDMMKSLGDEVSLPSASDLLRSVRYEPMSSIAEIKAPVTTAIPGAETIGAGPEENLVPEAIQALEKEKKRERLLKEFIEMNPLDVAIYLKDDHRDAKEAPGQIKWTSSVPPDEDGAVTMPPTTGPLFPDEDRTSSQLAVYAGTADLPTDTLPREEEEPAGIGPASPDAEERGNTFAAGSLTERKDEAVGADEDREHGTVQESSLFGSGEKPEIGIPVPSSMLMKDITVELILLDGEEDFGLEKQLLRRELPTRGRKRSRNDQTPVNMDEEIKKGAATKGITLKYSVANADKGIYTLVIKNVYERDHEIDVIIRLYQGDKKGRVKEYKAEKILSHGELNYKFILPYAVFWDDDDYFSGSIEGSDTITKFNDEMGLVWEEEKK